MLEHHSGNRAKARQVGARITDRQVVDQDLALLKRFERIDGLDQGRFPGARRPADHDDLTFGDAGRAIVQNLGLVIPFADVPDLDHGKAPGAKKVIGPPAFGFP